ncbi:hypothetical protein LCGC14_1682020 [marine sediment metagenome]|uniref:Uncharacterized protein n=1 Tax=marine sediment metagenome TaxID=412755 RepID=A0A0F9IAQ8_9ZZZZ
MLNNFTIQDQIKNCLKLAERMDIVDEDHYDQSNFFDREDYGKSITITKIHHCGTSACALGHAATMRYFNNRGIDYKVNSWNEYDYEKGKTIKVHEILLGKNSWENAIVVFGLADNNQPSLVKGEHCCYDRGEMFGGNFEVKHNGTPKGVAKALREHAESLREQL